MSPKTSATDTPTQRVFDFRVEGEHNGNRLVSSSRFHLPAEVLREFGKEWVLCKGGSNPFYRKDDGRWLWRLRKAG